MNTPRALGHVVHRDTNLPGTHGSVIVHHPDINPTAVILRLPAYDQVAPPNNDVFSVNHRVVLDACFVPVNNKEGYLRDSQQERCTLDRYPVLPAGPYWYEVANDKLYPIVDDFRAWLPPTLLPEHWLARHLGLAADENNTPSGVQTGSEMASRVKNRDSSTCVLSRIHSESCLALGNKFCSRLYLAANCD